jgi:hypothetical protein
VSVPARAFENVSQGATASFGFGTTPVGDTLLGEVGADWLGLRYASDLHWLMQWDVSLALRLGYLGNQHPYLFLIGPHATAWLEGGYRFASTPGFGPYVGARIGGDASVLGNPDVAQLDTINAVDGVGGIVARGVGRISAGTAYVDRARSVILTVFVQEMLQAAQINTPSRAFTAAGFAARVDLPKSIIATFEGGWGVTPARTNALLGTTDQTSRGWFAFTLRKIFKNGMWVGGAVTFERDTDHIVYETTRTTTFDTGDAPRFSISLTYGLPLWRTR